MIERIHYIRGVGKLQHVSTGKHTFAPLTLIYGQNGRGKSTFTHILHSLKTEDCSFIEKRRSGEQAIKIYLNKQDYIFDGNNHWSDNYLNIEVFDSHFINENVVAGNRSLSEHRHGLANWIFGSERIIIENNIAILNGKISELRDENKNLQSEIENDCVDMSISDFLALEPNPTIDFEIESVTGEIKALNDLEKIAKVNDFYEIMLREFPLEEFKQLLEMQLEDVAENAQLLVQTHLEEHKNISEEWLGVAIDENTDECPYCGQSLNENVLFDAYKTYFSEAYNVLKNRVEMFRSQLNNGIFDERVLSESLSLLEKNQNQFDFWCEYGDVALKDMSVSDVRFKLDQLEQESLKLLETKSKNLLDTISLSDEFQNALQNYLETVQQIEQYNEQVKQNNLLVKNIKNVDVDELPQKYKELKILELTKKRFQQPLADLCEKYVENERNLKLKKKEKTKLNQELKSTAENLLKRYGTSVEKYLNDFSIDVTVQTDSMKSDLRGKETVEFEIKVGNQSLSSEEAFEYNLSEGDKSTFAFAFFLARLDEMDLSETTIVFDDPISSQDDNRRRETRNKILELCKQAKQVIVLSHDALFLRELYRGVRWVNVEKATFHFVRTTDDDSLLQECDILEMTKGEYYQDYQVVLDFVNGIAGNARDVTTPIRRLLEEHIRQRFPSDVKQEHSLGQIIQSMVANPTSKLSKLNHRLADLNHINDFTSENGHGGSSRPSDGDAKRYASLALDIIENG